MKRAITKIVISIVILLSTVSFGSPNLSGQYWFGSLSVNADGSNPWGKRGTVSIAGNHWNQQWEDYDGDHEFSSAFTTTTQPDGSININFPAETYNVAFNGDVMIHAGSILNGGGEGIDIFMRKATNVDVNDVIGDYSFFGHWLGTDDRWDESGWGHISFHPDGMVDVNWVSSLEGSHYDTGTWYLDDVNAVVYGSEGSDPLLIGKNEMNAVFSDIPDIPGGHFNLGYDLYIKKSEQVITMAEIAGTYQVRFLETGPGGVPNTCGQGTCVIKAVDDANGILSLDAWYSNGEHDLSSIACSVGPGNDLYLDDESVPDGIVSPDKNLIFIPEYRYQNTPTRTEDDWIGGIFLIRMPDNFADLNGDGIVDVTDMLIMFEYWDTDNQLCDIAPEPWGDGIVDIQDLTVLTAHLNEVYPPAATVEVNEDNNSGQIELKQDQILVVTLESNPSTGYSWKPTKNDKSILIQLGKAEFKPSETSEPPMVGSGGWEIFRFRAISAGQMTLELIYHRSWEDAEPLKTFSIQVTVP